jgi:hypothetical protein
MPPAEEREDTGLAVAGQARQGWPSPLQQRLDLTIGNLHWLHFKPEMTGRHREPATECLIITP